MAVTLTSFNKRSPDIIGCIVMNPIDYSRAVYADMYCVNYNSQDDGTSNISHICKFDTTTNHDSELCVLSKPMQRKFGSMPEELPAPINMQLSPISLDELLTEEYDKIVNTFGEYKDEIEKDVIKSAELICNKYFTASPIILKDEGFNKNYG